MSNEIANIYGEQKPAVKSTTTEMMVGREAQEVQMAMYVAKKFPRDEVEAYNRIMRACQRKSLAEQSMYEYPRGGQKITGPSIRLAEALAQNWGNIDFGIMELDQKDNESSVMAYAWDLETNTRQTKIFQVPHTRYSRRKGNEKLTDPRDIYEMVANNGARRLRACILGVIPGDVIDKAIEQCETTLKNGSKEPLIDRVRKMVGAFEKEFSVTKEMLEKYIGCSSDAFSENDFIRLRKVYRSLKDNMAKREDYFEIKKTPEKVSTKLDGKFKGDTDSKKKEDASKAESDPYEGTPFETGADE